jgi:hypothetical protein
VPEEAESAETLVCLREQDLVLTDDAERAPRERLQVRVRVQISARVFLHELTPAKRGEGVERRRDKW